MVGLGEIAVVIIAWWLLFKNKSKINRK